MVLLFVAAIRRKGGIESGTSEERLARFYTRDARGLQAAHREQGYCDRSFSYADDRIWQKREGVTDTCEMQWGDTMLCSTTEIGRKADWASFACKGAAGSLAALANRVSDTDYIHSPRASRAAPKVIDFRLSRRS